MPSKPGNHEHDAEPAQSASTLNVKSVPKAFRLLEVFRDEESPLGLADLMAATGMDKSTVQRFAYTLKRIGYLEQDPQTRRYTLGRRVLDLSFGYLRSHSLAERAAPVLIDLRQALQERVDMTIPDGDSVLYVIRMQAKREHYAATLLGRRMPMFCSAGGRCVLARMPEEEALRIVQTCTRQKYTPSTQTGIEAIMREVGKAREQGYAIQSEEWRPGEIGAGAAVTDRYGHPIAAVHVAVSTGEWTVDEVKSRIIPMMIQAAASISTA